MRSSPTRIYTHSFTPIDHTLRRAKIRHAKVPLNYSSVRECALEKLQDARFVHPVPASGSRCTIAAGFAYYIYYIYIYSIYIKGFLIRLNNISSQFSCSVVTLWEQEWKGIWKVNTCRGVNNFGCKMDVIFHVQKISIYMEGFIRKRTRI